MEVDAISFPHHLLGILVAISESDFVSFDLELSGIPSRIPGKVRSRDTATLEDRYQETKEGAERYQILQVGITCARFDYLANKYVLRPYNINISPLLDERLDIEREISFQTGAVSFLLGHGFKMDLPFTTGVQYLSREEAAWAKQKAYDRFDKKNVVADLQLKETDVDSLDFVRRARQAITDWKKKSSDPALNITTHTGLQEQPADNKFKITRFEKRLVHQLVRAEFPDLISMGKADCIRIIYFDADREAENTRKMKKRAKDQIISQTGFRWVVEALARGDIHPIDPVYFARNIAGMVIAADMDRIRDRARRAEMRLKDKQPVLVGHNMFTDLVYFYRTFIGALPDTLDGFRKALHELFPRIVDTKYLATFDGGDLHASPTLQEIAEGLERQRLPDIVTHADHPKYHDSQAFHEAGFDSLLTATVMLRLSTKLQAAQQATAPASTGSEFHSSFKTAVEASPRVIDGQEKIEEPVAIPPIEDLNLSASPPKKSRNRKKKARAAVANQKQARKFATQNMFDGLRALDPETEEEGSSSNSEPANNGWTEAPPTSTDLSWQDQPYKEDVRQYEIDSMPREPMELLPSFDDKFWDDFGNRLRVFGTRETLLHVADWGRK